MTLPIPDFFEPGSLDQVWRVPYEERARQAAAWVRRHNLRPAGSSTPRIWLLLVDVQNTFCVPEFELFVAGRSATKVPASWGLLAGFLFAFLTDLVLVAAGI